MTDFFITIVTNWGLQHTDRHQKCNGHSALSLNCKETVIAAINGFITCRFSRSMHKISSKHAPSVGISKCGHGRHTAKLVCYTGTLVRLLRQIKQVSCFMEVTRWLAGHPRCQELVLTTKVLSSISTSSSQSNFWVIERQQHGQFFFRVQVFWNAAPIICSCQKNLQQWSVVSTTSGGKKA